MIIILTALSLQFLRKYNTKSSFGPKLITDGVYGIFLEVNEQHFERRKYKLLSNQHCHCRHQLDLNFLDSRPVDFNSKIRFLFTPADSIQTIFLKKVPE